MWRLGRPCMSDELGERGTAEQREENNELRSNTFISVEYSEPLEYGELSCVRTDNTQFRSCLFSLLFVCRYIHSYSFVFCIYFAVFPVFANIVSLSIELYCLRVSVLLVLCSNLGGSYIRLNLFCIFPVFPPIVKFPTTCASLMIVFAISVQY